MTKIYHFISGMPRSGSTLLCNLLNQNPRFGATPTSGLCQLLLQTNNSWSQISELLASATVADKANTLGAMFEGFHANLDRPVIFSKSRGWVCAFELLENLFGNKPKIIVTYRDIPSILSSCEKLFRKELAHPASVAQFGQNMETLEGRLAHWTDPTQIVGGSYNRIRDCVTRGHRANMHFVNFKDLTFRPKETLMSLYDFIGEEFFTGHNFDKVEQSTHEKDSAHGFVDLHTIRPMIKPVAKDHLEILGDAVKPYLHINYDFIER